MWQSSWLPSVQCLQRVWGKNNGDKRQRRKRPRGMLLDRMHGQASTLVNRKSQYQEGGEGEGGGVPRGQCLVRRREECNVLSEDERSAMYCPKTRGVQCIVRRREECTPRSVVHFFNCAACAAAACTWLVTSNAALDGDLACGCGRSALSIAGQYCTLSVYLWVRVRVKMSATG
jgi:hypothetical protein